MNKTTLNKDGSVRKKGSGRKKGATSFSNVTITDLENYIGKGTPIPVSRDWLENLGIEVVENKPLIEAKAEQAEEDQKISFNLTKF